LAFQTILQGVNTACYRPPFI